MLRASSGVCFEVVRSQGVEVKIGDNESAALPGVCFSVERVRSLGKVHLTVTCYGLDNFAMIREENLLVELFSNRLLCERILTMGLLVQHELHK